MTANKIHVWLGIDVGTTGVRAIAYDVHGKNYGATETFYPLLTPHPDEAEEDMQTIVQATQQVIRETTAKVLSQGVEIAGLALSTVMHSFAPLGANYEPLTPMVTWADSRAASIVRALKKDEKLCRRFYEKTCCPVHACYPLAKILHLYETQPALFAKMHCVGSIKDVLFYQLTGEWKIDRSAASTSGLYNAKELCWDKEILSFAHLTEDMLPPVVSTTYQGKLRAEIAKALGLPVNLPVVIGATDGVLVNLGIGAVQTGQLSATIGTSGALRMLTPQPRTDINPHSNRTWCYNLVDGMWVAGGAINNGGMILRWLRDNVCHFTDEKLANLGVNSYDLMTLKAAQVPAGAEGLILLPCFTGERAPYWNSDLRGMFFGLSLKHGRSHMIRATMEGICYSMKAVFLALQEFGTIKDIRGSGSFTHSSLWLQMLADVLGTTITLPTNHEGAAFGAAILGFMAEGTWKSIADAAQLVSAKQTYVPIAENVQTYNTLYDIFARLYQNTQKEMAAIVDFQKGL